VVYRPGGSRQTELVAVFKVQLKQTENLYDIVAAGRKAVIITKPIYCDVILTAWHFSPSEIARDEEAT